MHFALGEAVLSGTATHSVGALLRQQGLVSGDQVGRREATGEAGLKLFRRE